MPYDSIDDDIPLNGLSWIVNPQEYATLQVAGIKELIQDNSC